MQIVHPRVNENANNAAVSIRSQAWAIDRKFSEVRKKTLRAIFMKVLSEMRDVPETTGGLPNHQIRDDSSLEEMSREIIFTIFNVAYIDDFYIKILLKRLQYEALMDTLKLKFPRYYPVIYFFL